MGCLQGSVVAVNSRSRRLFIGLIHALPLLRCALQPLNPDWPHHTTATLLARTAANYLVTDDVATDWNIQSIDAAKLDWCVEISSTWAEQQSPTMGLDELQLLIATSGSGGEPKAVMLSRRNIDAAVAASRERIALEATDRWLLCLPLYHIGGVAIVQRCTQAGATVIMADDASGIAIATTLAKHSCTHVSLVPAMLARLLDTMSNPPLGLRHVLIGGAALDPRLAQRALAKGWPLCISYGMSEACSQVATLCHPQTDWPGQLVGKPLNGMQVRIDNRTGRLNLHGDAIMLGYANPERYPGIGLTADGWFETSDIGYLDADGQIWIQGRADQILISGGVKIHPMQVEVLLAQCPGITEVAISGRADQTWGECLVAVIVGSATSAQIETWCKKHLPGSMRPRSFLRVEALPRTTLGKLDRVMLRTMVAIAETP